MEYSEQVHLFATKWIEKFRDQKISYIELVDHYLADDCQALGFQMDCGHAFSEKYGDAASSCDALNRIIDEVTDIKLLGSAIYSQWRYFNHWAYDAADILKPENRSWFILALSRLALLSGENPFLFQGELRKIRLVSNRLGYGPCPEPDEEVEQHITLNAEGQVWLSSYVFGQRRDGRCEKAHSQNLKIDKAASDKIFSAFTESLIVDRESESIEHIQNIGSGCSVSRKYKVEGGVESLLEDMDAENIFDHIEGNPENVVVDPLETIDYTIKVISQKGNEKLIQGTYDKKGLPDDWAEFMESVFEFMSFYGWGEIMNPSVYGKVRRCDDDIIYCSVEFEDGYNIEEFSKERNDEYVGRAEEYEAAKSALLEGLGLEHLFDHSHKLTPKEKVIWMLFDRVYVAELLARDAFAKGAYMLGAEDREIMLK